MKELLHRVKIDASTEHVYKALVKESGLKSWAISKICYDETSLIWEASLGDMPASRWRVIEQVLPTLVAWRCEDGPPEVVGSVVRFRLSDAGDARTLVDLSHSNWRSMPLDMQEWNTVWGALLHHLKNYSETEVGDPAFD